MPPLYTLAYPLLSQADREFIDSYRSEHDAAFRDVVAPHFTMLFGCDQIAESQYKEHVRSVAARSKPVSFVCRYAMVCNDVSNENFYVFLVPDEGYSALSLLHDELYRGPLAPFLRLDAPYVPPCCGCDEPGFKTHQGPVRLPEQRRAQHGRLSRPPDNMLSGRRQDPRRSCSAALGEIGPSRPIADPTDVLVVCPIADAPDFASSYAARH